MRKRVGDIGASACRRSRIAWLVGTRFLTPMRGVLLAGRSTSRESYGPERTRRIALDAPYATIALRRHADTFPLGPAFSTAQKH